MRVLFLTLYPETMPSSRLRVYQYLPYLASQGIQADCLPAVPEPWFSRLYFSKSRWAKLLYCALEAFYAAGRVRQAARYDAVFVQKGILSTSLRGIERKLLSAGKRLIYDFDDDVLGRSLSEFRFAFLRSRQDPEQTLKLARAADTVIAGNAYLQRKIIADNPNTVILPTPVDTDRFSPSGERIGSGGELVLGWIGMEIGLSYVRSLTPVLQELARRYSFRLKIISRIAGENSFEIPGVKTQFIPWSYDTEVQEMREFDIGIMPVPEDEWGPGKCGLKLLQYMSMGIASVASRVGANRDIVNEDNDACLALSHQEWIEKLSWLMESPDRRKALGQAARHKVIENYSLKSLAPKFAAILKNERLRERNVPLSITYILPQMDIGGAEVHVVRLAEGLRRRGHDTRILCAFEEGRLAPWIREKQIPLEALHAKKWGPGVIKKIHHRLTSNPSGIVHSYLFGLHLFAGLPARFAGTRVILSSRRDVELSQPPKVLWLEKCGNFFSDGVVACSEAVRSWVLTRENLCPEKITVLYNGVDLSEFQPGAGREEIRQEFGIPSGVPLIGTVANFSPKKGYGYLIESAAKILEARPDCRFLFAGSGPLEQEMRAQAAQLPLGKNIIFTGARRDIPRLLAAMDIFVFASLWEGLPNVVLEAMSMARPIISTPAGGVPEVITEGVSGQLVPFRDPQAIAGAVLELLQHPEKAAALGRAARKKIETDFSLDRMIDNYEKYYKSLSGRNFQSTQSCWTNPPHGEILPAEQTMVSTERS